MPGIAAIISREPAEKCRARLDAMLTTMSHESFYTLRTHSIPRLGIYAGSITFENSSDGIFSNREQSIGLIFSGECFWDSEIAGGERLIELYESQGDKFLEKLNGLFCGLLMDVPSRKILLFNDRYGIQRIYHHEAKGDFYFASEAKALLRILPELRQFDPEGAADFVAFGCTLNWRTLFQGIQIVPGGSKWTIENGRCRKETYFSPDLWETQPRLPAEEFENRLRQTFWRVLPRYFGSGPKVGIALTGGLDTRMIMACRPRNNGHTTCYTFSGNNGKTFDDKIAARVAAASGLEHKLLRLGADFFVAFPAHADKTVFVTDGCAGISNTHEIYFNRQARELAPTRLTGNYGSEILRGVSTFKPIRVSPRLCQPEMRARVNSRAETLGMDRTPALTFAAFKEIPWNLFGNLAAGRSQVHFRTPYLDNEMVALAFQAPEAARKSAHPALGVIRESNSGLSEIPTDRGWGGENTGIKFLVRRLLAEATFKLDYYHDEGLPGWLTPLDPAFKTMTARLGVSGRHKFLHYPSWFRNELAPYVSEMVMEAGHRNSFWNPDFLKGAAVDHISGRRNHSREINLILTLESVDRQLFRELPRDF